MHVQMPGAPCLSPGLPDDRCLADLQELSSARGWLSRHKPYRPNANGPGCKQQHGRRACFAAAIFQAFLAYVLVIVN